MARTNVCNVCGKLSSEHEGCFPCPSKLEYRPRNDYCLIRRDTLGRTPSGIAVGDETLEGIEHVVVAKGPDVVDLEIGDKVMMIGSKGEDYAFVPRERNLLVIKQANIILVYKEVPNVVIGEASVALPNVEATT